MKKLIVLIFSLTILGTSCKKFLDEVPTDFVSLDNFFQNENDILSALAGVYDVMGKSSAFGRYFFLEMDISDESFYALSSSTQDLAFYNYNIGDNKLENAWKNLYDGINRANLLLEHIDKPTDLTD